MDANTGEHVFYNEVETLDFEQQRWYKLIPPCPLKTLTPVIGHLSPQNIFCLIECGVSKWDSIVMEWIDAREGIWRVLESRLYGDLKKERVDKIVWCD